MAAGDSGGVVGIAGIGDTTAVSSELTAAGFEVQEAATWTDATAFLAHARCIVLGPALPDRTGLGALSEISDTDLGVPVVIYDESVDEAAALDAGAADYVHPRDGFKALRARVERVVEQHDTQRELERESSMLSSLLRHIPLSVYIKDRQGRHVRVSESIVGGPDEHIKATEGKVHPTHWDLIGKTDFDLYHEDGAIESRETENHILETEESVDDVLQEFPPVEPHGWRVYTLTSKAPWYDHDGALAGIVGVTRDITEQKTYEKRIERQNKRLDRFAEAISHDLRNPLNVATGNLQLLAADVDHPRLAGIETALERMNDLIEDVLSLARQGKSVEDPERLAVTEIAREAWETVDTADATLDVGVDVEIRGDPIRLQRLFENLFRNAIDHVGTDVTVTIGRDGYVLYVEDDGPGVPEDDRDAIFDRGFTTHEDGTGFGLQIVAQIASAHDWTTAVTDGSNGGARFELRGVRPVTD